MFLRKTTPDGTFTVEIRSLFEDPDAGVLDVSLLELVELLEQTAQMLRLAQHDGHDARCGRGASRSDGGADRRRTDDY